ncbi:ATP-binding cassette transporter [Auriscalpium vulgare]|uniref:ATP-binding cassette transporter n=1 Tax=Auriscalpium vulgare TaxID=40419 RepID=A0ACB8R7T8_9AGAM|nr:ATP-binding cassette transporter [Auriscalpium vulgare]
MPRFQLAVAIALASAAVLSVGFLWLLRPKEGKVQLPVTTDGEDQYEHDAFDVTQPEDIVDGEPIDEQAFWARNRFREGLLSLTFAIIIALQTTSLGYAAYFSHSHSIAVSSLQLAFALYVEYLAVRAINRDASSGHTATIIHLSILSTLAAVLLGVSAMVPEKAITISFDDPQPQLFEVLWLATLGLYVFAAVGAATTPLGPALHFPPDRIYSAKTVANITNTEPDNVAGIVGASVWDFLLFSYTTKVVMLGNVAESLDIGDLPIVPGNMRATFIFKTMRQALRTISLKKAFIWHLQPGDGWELAYRLLRVNGAGLATQTILAASLAFLWYTPPFFLRQLVRYLEEDPLRVNRSWGWFYAICLFVTSGGIHLVSGQLWSISTTTLQVSIKVQLNSILFAKTLVRKDVASSGGAAEANKDKDKPKSPDATPDDASEKKDDDGDFSSKAQIMTLMTTDVDRVSEFSWHLFPLVDAPIEIVIGTVFLYTLLGVSSFFGLAVTCLFLPLNHFAGKVVVGAQDNLMKARDERVALMNEILGAIRMLKFMAWERSFEKRVIKIREKELKYQRLNYTIETLWNAIWNASPIMVTLVAFFHFTVIRREVLTPSIAFTSVSSFEYLFTPLLDVLNILQQSLVSLRRIEKYLHGLEVAPVPPLGEHLPPVAFQGATVTWPQDRTRSRTGSGSATASAAATPKNKFVLTDLNLVFPKGELSLVCGKLGSGKTLLLLALLGEADFLTGQVLCPRTPPDAIAGFVGIVPKPEDWVVEGVCAFVPQTAWLRNASIKDNILFNLPLEEDRYQKTLEVCALVNDLKILEDGDESEIGERGVNLSGGQKARVSLARAVYSRASILLLDDVLSAVDAHTAHHLYTECLQGELMRGRTIVLVSHHVQLCAPGAKYVVALDNGRVLYQGDGDGFQSSEVMNSLVQSGLADVAEKEDADANQTVEEEIEEAEKADRVAPAGQASQTSSTAVTPVPTAEKAAKKSPRKLIEEEVRAVGRIKRDVWSLYVTACGKYGYWSLFVFVLLLAALSPVLENGWLSIWSGAAEGHSQPRSPMFYIGIYALITGVVFITLRLLILYVGSIHASTVLYKKLLENVLFAKIRFHDTVSRGRLLNRFGKDFEGIDSNLSDNFGRSIFNGMSVLTTLITITAVGGWPFFIAILIVYGQTSRDMRRLDSVTRSPLYSIYGETISGVTIIRAFGASSKFLRDMLCCVDTNTSPYYWMWGVNRWLSVRFNLLSGCIVGVTAVVAVVTPTIDAALAGFTLAFASTVTQDVRRFVSLEQSMVALERIKEYSEIEREPAEFVEPRPPASWPSNGAIECQDLVIRYAPELPNVLHNVNFSVKPGEKVGILGRTGSGKSTLALSFFRFVEATEGRILVDGLDISKVGLTDLRSKLTIIPQDPTILSGTLRSTLDVFDEYKDPEIYEALRRVHLIPPEGTAQEAEDTVNANVFRDLDSPVSEGGENFSTGEKQLLCMARAILKRSKVLVMDEVDIVDYATDELISKTIRHEFADSTILTIAHRLRTVIDYNRVMLLDEGKIVEFDSPAALLSNPNSKFYALCKATGGNEFAVLKKMAGAK